MYYGYRQELTDNERYLQDEVDRLQEEQRRGRERREQEREERMREYRAESERNSRSANSWREAIQKQVYLMNREVDQWDTPEMGGDNYFRDSRDCCKRGLEIWTQIEAGVQPEIEVLEAKIKAIKEGIRQTVSDLLLIEADGRPGWKSTASAIGDEEDFNRWLDW